MNSGTSQDWRRRQVQMNAFTDKFLKGVGAIPVDGLPGALTEKRITNCQWWLGWNDRNRDWSDKLDWHLKYPRSRGRGANRVSTATVVLGTKRRAQHNFWWVKSHLRSGVTSFDGVRVCACAVPILLWCRAHGWHGRLVSGYRDPAYSTHLCYAMCGRPSCPGRCAGAASNHSGNTCARFAVDVSDYVTFRSVVARCPLRPHIFNALPSDPVHFSPSGR